MASHLHRGLFETLATTTLREYRLWMAWFALELDRPSRSDYYLMQIAAEVLRGNVKQPRQVKLQDMQLTFEAPPRRPTTGLTQEEECAITKAKWLGMMTLPVQEVRAG